VWVDGVHFNIRLEDDQLCTLVMIGAEPKGEKELLAVEDGYRESTESWKMLLRELKRRGLVAPVVAVGDGGLGFWAAAREVWPETRAQGCWCHKLVNVLDKLPQRLQPCAKRALHEMMYAQTRSECEAAKTRFRGRVSGQVPRAAESLSVNWERLTAFFDSRSRCGVLDQEANLKGLHISAKLGGRSVEDTDSRFLIVYFSSTSSIASLQDQLERYRASDTRVEMVVQTVPGTDLCGKTVKAQFGHTSLREPAVGHDPNRHLGLRWQRQDHLGAAAR
jgi:hypothetical protein